MPDFQLGSPGWARVVANQESKVALLGLTWSSMSPDVASQVRHSSPTGHYRRLLGTSRALISPPPSFQPSRSSQLCGLRTTSGS